MTLFALVIMSNLYTSTAPLTFSSERDCQAAAAQIQDGVHAYRVYTFCVRTR